MKTFELNNEQAPVGYLELVLSHMANKERARGVRLPFHSGRSLIGTKAYKEGKKGLCLIVESVQLLIRVDEEGCQVVDCASENGNTLVKARSAAQFLDARSNEERPEDALTHPEDVIPLPVTPWGDPLPWLAVSSGDLIDHLYATWRLVVCL